MSKADLAVSLEREACAVLAERDQCPKLASRIRARGAGMPECLYPEHEDELDLPDDDLDKFGDFDDPPDS